MTWKAFRESPIDFLPADVTEDDVTPKGFFGSAAAGFRAPDLARQRLEMLLEARCFGAKESEVSSSMSAPAVHQARRAESRLGSLD